MKKFFEKNDLVKIVGLMLVLVTVLSWIIPSSYYYNNEWVNSGLARIGIETFFNATYYGISYYLTQIIFILVLGGFYGILSVTNGYKKLVANCAKALKGNSTKNKIILVLIALFVAAFTSISNDILPVLLFIPFIITVVLKAGYDKYTAFSLTFGSLFVGLTGATYSHYNFDYIRNYLGITSVTEGILIKTLIFVLSFALLMLITIMRLNSKSKNKEELAVDLYAVEELDKKAKVKVWPLLVVLGFIVVYTILGYIDWEANFKITAFTKFFDWLSTFSIGDYTLFAYILGLSSYSAALGQLQIISLTTVLIIAAGIIALIYHLSFEEYCKAFGEGLKKILKPTFFYLVASMMFVFSYNTYIFTTIANFFFGLTKSFNPFIMALVGILGATLNVDHGFTAYLIGAKLATTYATSTTPIMVILNATYGFAQFVVPTSILLFFALSYLDIPYKSYLKHFWKYLVGLLVMLLIVFIAISY